jgi:TonB-dependent receptor
MVTYLMRILVRLTALMLLGGLTLAAPSQLHAQGVVTGTVIDEATDLALTGVIVRVDALNREVATDRNGRFTFIGMPAGSHELSTRYIGYAPARTTVTVTNGRTATVRLVVRSAVTELGALVVTATRSGQASALNQQQNAANVTNVVAADQIGRFPDANIGDALKRIPGVTVALDQGEARFGSIRGTEPRFNSVMVNGERIPSAEAEVREVQLDLIPADMVQAIEVNKTLTPEMDADAIGGSVNVVTRAAPSGFRFSTTLGSGYNYIREEPVLLGSAVIGTRFLNDRLGVIASGSYYDQKFGSDNKEGVWDKDDDGNAFMEEFDTRRYDVQRIRRSVSASLDYRLGDNSTIMLRSIYNHRDDWENRFRARYVLGDPNAQGIQNTEIRRQTKGGGPADGLKNARLEDQRTQSHQLSGDHLLTSRGVRLTWSASVARASETRPDERYVEWRSRNVSINPDYSDEQNPQFNATNPAQVEPTAFTFRRIEQLESFTRDLDRNARADLLFPLSTGELSSRLKVGVRYRGKDKNRDNSYNFAVPVGGAPANLTLLDNADFTVDENLAGNYPYGVFTTPEQLAGLALFDPTRFTLEDQPGEYAAGNFEATEKITAGYAQLEQELSRTVSIIAGARVERTDVDYNGFEFDVDDETVRPTTGSQAYTDVLPSINVRWQAAPATVVRAAWTNAIARPNYFDLVPYREVSLDDDELAVGNPALKPTKSMNFDLSVERYFESVGLISVGLFHKEITDFIFNFTEFGATDPVTNRVFSEISRPRNGAEAKLTGAEFAVQRQLDFLPGALRYFGIYANYTYNSSSVEGLDIEGRELEDLPLLGTAEHSANVSVSYDAPRLTFRVALNYQSESLDAGEGGYNEDAFFDRWADRRTDIDANASYLVTPRARLFVEANNLNNRPLRFYQGERGRLMQDEYYGRRIQAGFKLDF